jgi:hypothetical protein
LKNLEKMTFLPLRYWIKTAIEDITFFLVFVPVMRERVSKIKMGGRESGRSRPEIIGVYWISKQIPRATAASSYIVQEGGDDWHCDKREDTNQFLVHGELEPLGEVNGDDINLPLFAEIREDFHVGRLNRKKIKFI